MCLEIKSCCYFINRYPKARLAFDPDIGLIKTVAFVRNFTVTSAHHHSRIFYKNEIGHAFNSYKSSFFEGQVHASSRRGWHPERQSD